ncbi:MAG: D-alanyl-D-alanine carboxypeptidase/D-alanyl-D-alanine-endopeptidase, partial [Ferruginibacter sp.]
MFQRTFLNVCLLMLIAGNGNGQNLGGLLDHAIQKLSADVQFKHAVISLLVIDDKTGTILFDKNSHLGLAPASCQKVITSVSAFELLGKKFQFKTYIAFDLRASNDSLKSNLYVTGRGDPTLGSLRWHTTTETMVLEKILGILQKHKIHAVPGDLICDDTHFTSEPVPGGWVWEDIGNYYGAGAWGLNWRENQFDVTFSTGLAQHDPAEIITTIPSSFLKDYAFVNFVRTGARKSGDNAYLFSSPFQKSIIARGTVPMSANGFTISGSMPDPPGTFIKTLQGYLKDHEIVISGNAWSNSQHLMNNMPLGKPGFPLDSILSPFLDSINYWFLKKSVNLFGESLIKTISYKMSGNGSTDTGITIIKSFWEKHGIESSELNMIDGSGLSPANRITTHALVTVMQYAKKREWFDSFYNALPLTNNLKMKDGYISGVRSYTGYAKSKKGR